MENQLIGAVHVQCFQVRNKDAVEHLRTLTSPNVNDKLCIKYNFFATMNNRGLNTQQFASKNNLLKRHYRIQ